MGTFDDNRRHHAARAGAFRHVGFRLDPPSTDIGLRRKVERFPFVPADPARLELDCFEAYNIQVSGLEQRLRAIGDPKVVIGVSGGLDSTHALIVAARAMDREGRPRSDILGVHAARLRHRRRARRTTPPPHADRSASRRRSSTSPTTARLMLKRPGPPVRGGRAGVRRHVRERPGRAAHRLPVPRGQPARRHRARHRRPVRAGARLVHVRRRRPDGHYNVNARRAEDADPAPDPVGGDRRSSSTTRSARCCPTILDTEITPGARARRRGRGGAEQRGQGRARTRCRTSRSSTCCATASARRRSPSWPGTPGTTPTRGDWPPGFPDGRAARRTTWRRSGTGWRCSCRRFFAFSQFKRSAMPNGPKVSAGGSLSPRGDWRAPSDLSARIWLDEIATIPTPDGESPFSRRRVSILTTASRHRLTVRVAGIATRRGGTGDSPQAGASTTTGRARPSRSRTNARTWPSGAKTPCTPSTPAGGSGRPCARSAASAGSASRRGERHRHRLVERERQRRGRFQRLQGAGVRERERAHPRAPQRREVAPDTQRGAEVAGQRAHVGARRALDRDVEVGAPRGPARRTPRPRRAAAAAPPPPPPARARRPACRRP